MQIQLIKDLLKITMNWLRESNTILNVNLENHTLTKNKTKPQL